MDTIVTLVNTVGFPIACCIALFYQGNKTSENYQDIIFSMQKTIENNTLALQELSMKLEGQVMNNGQD